jgi:hypothetical protein
MWLQYDVDPFFSRSKHIGCPYERVWARDFRMRKEKQDSEVRRE